MSAGPLKSADVQYVGPNPYLEETKLNSQEFFEVPLWKKIL